MQANQQAFPLTLTYQQYNQRCQNLEGYRVGHYKIQNQLGKGSFGKVYKAVKQNGDIFALKLLDKKEVRNQKNVRIKEIRERLNESQPKLMQQCDSPNLLKCFEIFENQDLKILIMEYCNGQTLSEELKNLKKKTRNKCFSQKQAVDILRHIINGIAELHKHRIVHRDLKTDNIMKHQGIYKIIDFGFSKKLQLSYQYQKTKNTVLGTPTTMAPEVMFHKKYGLKADIWSIGIIFFEIVFGIPPYDSSNAKHFFQQIQKRFQGDQPTPFKGVTLSREAHDFLKKVLKVDPDQRIGWREMIDHPLIKIKQQQSITGRFIERLPLDNPVVAEQLENGSLIQRQIQIDESEIKAKQQVEPPKQIQTINNNSKQKQKYKQKQKEKGENKKEAIKKHKFDLQKMVEQQKQAKRLRKRTQINKSIQLQDIKKIIKQENSERSMLLIRHQQSNSPSLSEIKQESQFDQCRLLHLQCLKAEFIFKQIFEPIQSRNIIDLSKRQSIQFMYLLISRCFKNVSLLKEKLKINPQKLHRSLRNLDFQVKSLYGKVVQRFQWYDKQLFQIQNKYTQIAKDFFLKIFNNKSQKQKNKIIGGVELRQEIASEYGDFSKEQQIQFTCGYIHRILPKMQTLGQYSENVKKRLKLYELIMNITLQALGQQSFKQFVKRIVMNH